MKLNIIKKMWIYLIIIVLIVINFYCLYRGNSIIASNRNMKKKYDKILDYLKIKNNYEGQNILEVFPASFNCDNTKKSIVIIINSISCPSCIKYYATELKKYEDLIPFYVLSNNSNYNYIQEFLTCKKLQFDNTELKGNSVNDFSIFIISSNGTIVFVEIPDKANYERSKYFFRYLENIFLLNKGIYSNLVEKVKSKNRGSK